MNRYDYEKVRESVSAEDAGFRYGMRIIRHKARCPFHNDHSPSLNFYGMRFRCYACDASGSSIDLTAQLLGITPSEAVRQLAEEFGIPIGENPSAETKKRYAQQKKDAETYKAYNVWREKTLQQLSSCYRLAHQAIMHGCPDGSETAIRWQPIIEYWLDLLESKETAHQIEIFRIRREVSDRCKMISESMRKRSGTA